MVADNRCFEEEVIADMQYKQIFSTLNEREKKIISLGVEGKTQREIAEIFGLSQSYVSKIIKSVHKKWRKQNDRN